MTPVVAVVDDDTSMLQSLGDLLESAGYAVRLFPSAASLLNDDNLASIDCLVTDIGMPVVDGLELNRIVQRRRAGLPVILITGHEVTDQMLASVREAHDCFRKPFNDHELLAAVRDAIGSVK
jgi:FixJ family two-component response regulator